MANRDAPHGLNAVKMLNGGKIPMNKYTVAATTSIGKGDVVTLRANGLVATLKTTGGANNILGVAAAYAEISGDVWVYDDPNTIFETQGDNASDPGSTTAQAFIGGGAPLVVTAFSNKLSQHELGTGTALNALTTGTADPLQIMGYLGSIDNDKSLAHARFLVLLRKHIWAPTPEAQNII